MPMRVRVDGNEVPWDLSGCASLGAALGEIYRKVGETARIVGRVEIDGQELTNLAEKELGDRTLESVGEIAVSTGTAEDLFRSGLQGALSLAGAIDMDIAKAVEAFRSGDSTRGQALHAACIEAMGTFFELAGGILNGIRSGYFNGAGVASRDVSAPSAGTAGILDRLLDHQVRRDWSAMADLLEYEVAPNLREWVAFLETLPGGQEK